MIRAFLILFSLSSLNFGTFAGEVPAEAEKSESPRLVIMPLADLAIVPQVVDLLEDRMTEIISKDSFECVSRDELSGVLRQYRIRNTVALSAKEMSEISYQTGAEYMISGSLNQYAQFTREAEVSLSLRLTSLPEGNVLSASTISRHSRNRVIRFPWSNRWKASSLVDAVLHKAIHKLEIPESTRRGRVIDVGDTQLLVGLGSRIAILPLANETQNRFASEIVDGQLLTYLKRYGYEIVEPGLVREAMLRSVQLSRGEAAQKVLEEINASCNADWVLTGVVRDFSETEGAGETTDCSAGIDLRLINPRSGEIVWSESIDGDGLDSIGLFGTNRLSGVSCLTDRLVKKLVERLPSRIIKPVRETSPETLSDNH